MQLFDRGAVHDVVLGVGLVGGAVCTALARRAGVVRTSTAPTPWGEPQALAESLSRAEAWLGNEAQRTRIFWCAGRAGFASTEADLARELESFRLVLEWGERLARRRPTEFHLTSSAGGLHEGQLRVTSPSPAPHVRPYGRLKLEQERLLSSATGVTASVYRPSSVYGVPRGKARLGMIPTLIRNALARRPSTISASPGTLRDYVSAHDVGAFIASDGRPPGLNYLVMGLPLSIFSLVAIVERALQRSVAVVYTTTRQNDLHITFAPSLRPSGWNPSSLESQVALIVAALQRGRS